MVTGNGLIQPPQFLERTAKIAVCLGKIGLDSEGFMVAGDGLIQLPQFLERVAKVAVCRGVIGLDGKGLCNQVNGNVVFPHLMGNHPQQMQGDRLTGLGLQYLLVEALGFG